MPCWFQASITARLRSLRAGRDASPSQCDDRSRSRRQGGVTKLCIAVLYHRRPERSGRYRSSRFRATVQRPCSPMSFRSIVRACHRNGRASVGPVRCDDRADARGHRKAVGWDIPRCRCVGRHVCTSVATAGRLRRFRAILVAPRPRRPQCAAPDVLRPRHRFARIRRSSLTSGPVYPGSVETRPAPSRHLPVAKSGWDDVWLLSGSIFTAVLRRMSRTWSQRSCGLADSMSALVPAQTGVA